MLRTIAFSLTLALTSALGAQDFSATDYYGGAFRADPDRPSSGVLRDSLTGDQPAWIEFSGSGDDLAADRFILSEHGLSVRPDRDHGTCEALIDVGVSTATLQVQISVIEQGSAVAWHLRDLGGEGARLVELKHHAKGGFELRIRVRNGGRYIVAPGSTRQIEKLELPVNLIAYIDANKLTGEVGGVKTEFTGRFESGVSAGLAVTDEDARVSDLLLTVALHESWVADANQRLLARNALGRLREFATLGLLSGLSGRTHPELTAALAALTEEDQRTRGQALAADIYERAALLVKLAAAYPKQSAIQHEAGMSSLIAGDVSAAVSLLTNADRLKRSNLTSLALAEAYRRAGEVSKAESALSSAGTNLPDDLRADYALIDGRIRADRGDIEGAERTLRKAAQDFPEHDQLQAFADSAGVLFEPGMLSRSTIEGPLGLTLLTDLSPAQLVPILERLKPHIERFQLWLPDLKEKLSGCIAIFSSPVAYLRAALLVAGDNLDNVAGMYLSHGIKGGPTVMACRAFGEDELMRTLIHELWHLALASTGAERSVPRWLNEGMAVYLSAGRLESGVLRYDTLPSEFEGFLKASPDVDRLQAALDAGAAEFYVPGMLRENYAAAWSLALVLATGDGTMQLLRDMLRGDAKALAQVNAERMHAAVAREVTRILKD